MPKTLTWLVLLIIIFSISWVSSPNWRKEATLNYAGSNPLPKSFTAVTLEKMHARAMEAKTFARRKNYNENVCFLLDMSIPSGQNRFFIYDLKKDSVQKEALVAHGNCFEFNLEGRKYSNVVGSGCTSLGKYKIGNSYIGKFGLSYKLHGLDSTNNNAFERTVVMHGYSCVPETEVADEICQSNGCPAVSPAFFQYLRAIIGASSKPVLLWVYE